MVCLYLQLLENYFLSSTNFLLLASHPLMLVVVILLWNKCISIIISQSFKYLKTVPSVIILNVGSVWGLSQKLTLAFLRFSFPLPIRFNTSPTILAIVPQNHPLSLLYTFSLPGLSFLPYYILSLSLQSILICHCEPNTPCHLLRGCLPDLLV